jgi:hypothetical protein
MLSIQTLNLKLDKEVVNLYGFHEEHVPKKAPVGKLFFIVTPNATAANRRYLYQLKRGKAPIWFHDREKSMAFNRIEIASSFCRFIREAWMAQAYVVLESGNSRAR